MKKTTQNNGILKGAMILAAATFLSKLIGILYRIPVTNILGDEGNAIYGIAYQVYIVLLGISAVGLPSAISKLIAECMALHAYDDAKRVFRVSLIYTGLLSGLLSLTLWFGADLIALSMNNMPELALPLRVLSPTIFIVSIMAVIRGYLQGLNTMTPTAISQVVEQLFNGVFSILLAYCFLKYGVEVAAAGSTMGTGIGAFAGFIALIIMYKYFKPDAPSDADFTQPKLFNSNKAILKTLLLTIIPMVITTSIFSIITLIDSYMLSYTLPHSIDIMRDAGLMSSIPVTDVALLPTSTIAKSLLGQYSNKYIPLIHVPISLILIVSVSAIPAISKANAQKNIASLTSKVTKILRIGFLLAIPATIGLTIFALPVMELLYPLAPDGGELLMYGSVAIIFITLAQLSSSILQGMGKQYIPTLYAGIACIVKIIANVILLGIPGLHIYAVIHSTTLCYMAFAFLNIRYLKKQLKLDFPLKQLWLKPLIASSIMGIIAYGLYATLTNVINSPNLILVVVIGIAIGIYGGIGLLIKMITPEDLQTIPFVNKFFKA